MEPTSPNNPAETVADTSQRVKDTAQGVVDKAQSVLQDQAEQRTAQAADMGAATANSLRRVAEDVSADNPWIGAALRKSADSVEAATQSFAGGDLNKVSSDLASFARRQPAIFLGASLALGFALARVGKTAVERTAPQQPTFGQGNFS